MILGKPPNTQTPNKHRAEINHLTEINPPKMLSQFAPPGITWRGEVKSGVECEAGAHLRGALAKKMHELKKIKSSSVAHRNNKQVKRWSFLYQY